MRSYVLRIGSPAFSLAADPGSFALTGQAATLRPARRVAASGGSVSITGTAATLTYDGGGEVEPSFEETWQSYTSLPNDGSAPGIHYAINASVVTGTLHDGSTGKFIRCQYPGGNAHGSATVQLSPAIMSSAKPRHIWFENHYRVNSGWASGLTDDKTGFTMEDWSDVASGEGAGEGEVWRWADYLTGTSPYGGPYYRLEPFENFGPIGSSIYGGNWFRRRCEYKMASNPSATDGIYRVWINDTLVTNRTGIQTDTAAAAFFRVMIFGANADPGGVGQRDVGEVKLWLSNPGW